VSETTTTPVPAPAGGRTRFGASFAGLGSALPATVVPNAEIAERIGVDDEWITSRTGISERRYLQEGETLAELTAQAGQAALDDAGLDARDVDLLLVATASPDDIIPNLAPAVAGHLGCPAGALDVGGACAGFLASVDLAAAHLESGRAEHVLVIGAERLSQFVDRDDKRTAALFGDAAAGAVVSRVEGPTEVHPFVMRSDPQRDLLFASRQSALIEMEGYEVFQHAVRNMREATLEAIELAGTTLEEIDLFVYHQANARIIRSLGQKLGLPMDRVVDCIATYGNVSAASVPLALQRAREEGRLPDGAKVLMSAFGAGFVWGATVIDWRASHA
jgi:3-oxoacyl-[acyl-carrier-protein] synthase III